MRFSKFFVCVILVTELVAAEIIQFDSQKWRQQAQVVNGFECKNPQPRFVSFQDLMNGEHSIYRSSPSGAVLHRCKSAGCCGADKECKPIGKNNVKLLFQFQKAGKLNGNTTHLLSLDAENHTLCGCQSI